MRRAAKTDRNQAEIVAALRKAGCAVQDLSAVGRGVPDLLVARAGLNILLEVKDGKKPPSDRRLTPEQEAWHAAWPGDVYVVTSVTEALAVIAGAR